MTERRTGGCLCGAVRVDVALPSLTFMACHCAQCQRWTGGGPLYSISVEDVRLTGEDRIGVFKASDWGERAFCRDCGSTLFWRMAGGPIDSICPGLLDDQTGLSVSKEIFTDRRAPWMAPLPHTAQSTEAQEFAKLETVFAGEKP